MLILSNLLEQSTNVATRDESTFILEMLLGLLIHMPLDDRTKNLVKQTLLRCVEREDDRNVRIRLCSMIAKASNVFGGENRWPELSNFIHRCSLGPNVVLREAAMLIQDRFNKILFE
ncbi:importin-5-like protein [Tanacetum coccineum]